MFKRKAEIMQYQTDKLSYSLCIFGIIFDMIYFVSLYTNRAVVPDFTIGVDILVNIVFMMIAFLASEKLNVITSYSIHYTKLYENQAKRA